MAPLRRVWALVAACLATTLLSGPRGGIATVSTSDERPIQAPRQHFQTGSARRKHSRERFHSFAAHAPSTSEAYRVLSKTTDAQGNASVQVLIWSTGRSGSTFFGEALDASNHVLFFYEPCRSFEKQFSNLALTECARLIQRLLSCEFTRHDVDTLYTDISAIQKSRVLRNPTLLGDRKPNADWIGDGGGSKMYTPLVNRHERIHRACTHSPVRVAKEIRFMAADDLAGPRQGGLDLDDLDQAVRILLNSQVRVVNLLRDPRAVLHSQMQLEPFCKSLTAQACASELCSAYRASAFAFDNVVGTANTFKHHHHHHNFTHAHAVVTAAAHSSMSLSLVKPHAPNAGPRLSSIFMDFSLSHEDRAKQFARMRAEHYYHYHRFRPDVYSTGTDTGSKDKSKGKSNSTPLWGKGQPSSSPSDAVEFEYFPVRYEDMTDDPVEFFRHIYEWLGLTFRPIDEAWIRNHTQAKESDNAYKTQRDTASVVYRWADALDEEALDAASRECGDVLLEAGFIRKDEIERHMPTWQTTPGTSIGGRVIGGGRDLKSGLEPPPPRCPPPTVIPAAAATVASNSHNNNNNNNNIDALRELDVKDMDAHFSAWCGGYSAPMRGYTATGGHSSTCLADASGMRGALSQAGFTDPEVAEAAAAAGLPALANEHRASLMTMDECLAALMLTANGALTAKTLYEHEHDHHWVRGGGRVTYDMNGHWMKHHVHVEAEEGCSALTFEPRVSVLVPASPDNAHKHARTVALGTCRLHNRSATDFRVGKGSSSNDAAALVLRMVSGVDSCLANDEALMHAKNYYLGERYGMPVPPKEKKFYMYSDPVYDYTPLIECHFNEHAKYPWDEHNFTEATQNAGAMWLHQAMKVHPLRTLDPEEADLFVIPFDTFLSQTLQFPCERAREHGGATHAKRVASVAQHLRSSEFFRRHRGHDHLLVSAWFGTPRACNGPTLPNTTVWWENSASSAEEGGLWDMLKDTAVLATIDEFFARDWNKVVVVPYVPHMYLNPDYRLANITAGPKRESPFYFRGGISHGLQCPLEILPAGAWIRRNVFKTLMFEKNVNIVPTENGKWTHNNATMIKWIFEKLTIKERQRISNPSHKNDAYAHEVAHAMYCMHLRGDTSTSRRVFDAIAASCVPFIVSDDTHLPFPDQVDYASFTVAVSEYAYIKGTTALIDFYQSHPQIWKAKFSNMPQAQRDLVLGHGPSPTVEDGELKWPHLNNDQRIASHLLQQAFELAAVRGKYRRYSETFRGCLLPAVIKPGKKKPSRSPPPVRSPFDGYGHVLNYP